MMIEPDYDQFGITLWFQNYSSDFILAQVNMVWSLEFASDRWVEVKNTFAEFVLSDGSQNMVGGDEGFLETGL